MEEADDKAEKQADSERTAQSGEAGSKKDAPMTHEYSCHQSDLCFSCPFSTEVASADESFQEKVSQMNVEKTEAMTWEQPLGKDLAGEQDRKGRTDSQDVPARKTDDGTKTPNDNGAALNTNRNKD